MHHSIPSAAAYLLHFIYKTETSYGPPQCYEVIYGHNQTRLKRPITTMTLDEIEAEQRSWSRRFGSSATGAAQFMRNTLDAPKTLRDIEGEMGLTGSELFTPDLQDRMAYHLLKRRGYHAYMAGQISRTEFGKRLAQEWASFPVLVRTKGAHRTVNRGQSYYAGDGLNKSLVKPETVEAVLDHIKRQSGPIPVPTPRPITPAAKVTWVAALAAALSTAVFTAWSWITELPCNLVGLFCGG